MSSRMGSKGTHAEDMARERARVPRARRCAEKIDEGRRGRWRAAPRDGTRGDASRMGRVKDVFFIEELRVLITLQSAFTH